MRRLGISLIELLVALTISGIAGLITLPLVVATGRVASRATAALAADRTVASLAALLRHDLRLASADEITPTSPTLLWLARPVGEGPICESMPGSMLLRAAGWNGDRLPVAGRDIVQFLPSTAADEWRDAPVAAIASGSCPDGETALRLDVATDPSGSTHLRILEPARLTAYASGGASWLGLAGPGDPNQPFAGPVASGGMSLADVGGALMVTLVPLGGSSRLLHFPVAFP